MSETVTKTAGVQDKVVLLLGAGASVDAGIPATVGMIATFEGEALQKLGDRSKSAYQAVSGLLRPHLEGQGLELDIERLLEALEQLQHRDTAPLSPFIAAWAEQLADVAPDDFQSVSRELRAHLRRTCDVRLRQTEYLRPLRDFVEGQGSLDVFSLNYDMCVEQVCHFYEIPYTDGFSATWDPELFEAERFKVRLHKIHGSVSWFRTKELKSRLVRAPLSASVMASQTPTDKVPYFTGVDLDEVLVYPLIAKETHVDPHATLLARFRAALRRSQFLIVIGCSFRDEYVRGVVYEGMAQNPELQLVLVSPDAERVYRAPTERYYLCDFAERILAVPRKAKAALSGGHLYRLIDVLRGALRLVKMSDDQLRENGAVDVTHRSPLVRSLASISHDELSSVLVPKYQTVATYLPRLDDKEGRREVFRHLQKCFDRAFIHWVRAQKERGDKQVARFWLDYARELSILVTATAYVPGAFPADSSQYILERLVRNMAPLVTELGIAEVPLGFIEEACRSATTGVDNARISLELEFPEPPLSELEALREWFETLSKQLSGVWQHLVTLDPQLRNWREQLTGANPRRPLQPVDSFVNASSSARDQLSALKTPWTILDTMRGGLG